MGRPRKFECLIEFWTLPEHFEAFDQLARNGMLTKSDHYRAAFDLYLRHLGALRQPQPQARPNGSGHYQQQPHHGAQG